MEAALKQFAEQVHVKPEDLCELDLDDQGITELKDSDMKALAKCHKLAHLSIGDNGMKRVAGNFPSLPSLTMLDLRGNELTSDVLGTLGRLVNLEVLMLTHNSIKTLDKFSHLKGLSKLNYLGLDECPLTELFPDYRNQLFELLPSVQVIDFIDREGNELERPDEDSEDSENGNLADFYNNDISDDEDEEDDEFAPGEEEEEEDEEEEGDEEDEDVQDAPAKKAKH